MANVFNTQTDSAPQNINIVEFADGFKDVPEIAPFIYNFQSLVNNDLNLASATPKDILKNMRMLNSLSDGTELAIQWRENDLNPMPDTTIDTVNSSTEYVVASTDFLDVGTTIRNKNTGVTQVILTIDTATKVITLDAADASAAASDTLAIVGRSSQWGVASGYTATRQDFEALENYVQVVRREISLNNVEINKLNLFNEKGLTSRDAQENALGILRNKVSDAVRDMAVDHFRSFFFGKGYQSSTARGATRTAKGLDTLIAAGNKVTLTGAGKNLVTAFTNRLQKANKIALKGSTNGLVNVCTYEFLYSIMNNWYTAYGVRPEMREYKVSGAGVQSYAIQEYDFFGVKVKFIPSSQLDQVYGDGQKVGYLFPLDMAGIVFLPTVPSYDNQGMVNVGTAQEATISRIYNDIPETRASYISTFNSVVAQGVSTPAFQKITLA